MQIAIPIEKFQEDKVFFCNKTENTVINGGGFYRVMYCDRDVTMLGVHITFTVDMTIEDGLSSRLDVREALVQIAPSVIEIIDGLTRSIHNKWISIHGDKPISYPCTFENERHLDDILLNLVVAISSV